ncbi:MAG: acetylglutamate kinase [Epsilonproteobacteria bacterium]|nr:MAG: acetylglutamate kinase [Campylobacterota bacterium]
MKIKQKKISTLLDALPYIKKFYGKTIVIKYGGSAQTNDELKQKFALDISLLVLVGIKPVIVHGGGEKISQMLDALDIKSSFIDGHRVTCAQSMNIVEMVLSGSVNKEITSLLNFYGVKSIGISGKDSNLIKAKTKDSSVYGFTGDIVNVDGQVINNLLSNSLVPVIAPIGYSGELSHPGFNINADMAASKIATAIKADKVLFLTDTKGVLDKDGKLLSSMDRQKIEKYKKDGTIVGGMIPKVDSCIEAIYGGVDKAHIIDGAVEHSILLELFTSDGIGTQILKDTI